MDGGDLLAITLYVPDATVRALNPEGGSARCIQDEGRGLDFILPGWWERSHTVRLGPLRLAGEPHVPPVAVPSSASL